MAEARDDKNEVQEKGVTEKESEETDDQAEVRKQFALMEDILGHFESSSNDNTETLYRFLLEVINPDTLQSSTTENGADGFVNEAFNKIQAFQGLSNNDDRLSSAPAVCQICFDDEPAAGRPCCGIPLCQTCFKEYLTLQINEGNVNVTCPNVTCNKTITVSEIEITVDSATKKKFDRFQVNKKQEANRKTCPRCDLITTLGKKILNDKSLQKSGVKVKCQGCALDWCFNCQAPWHSGFTCRDYQLGSTIRNWAKQISMDQINAMKCPKCEVYIQRNGGCDHMHCTKCGSDFCYRCGKGGWNSEHTCNPITDTSTTTFTRPNRAASVVKDICIIFAVTLGACVVVPLAAAVFIAASPFILGGTIVNASAQRLRKIHRRRKERSALKRSTGRDRLPDVVDARDFRNGTSSAKEEKPSQKSYTLFHGTQRMVLHNNLPKTRWQSEYLALGKH